MVYNVTVKKQTYRLDIGQQTQPASISLDNTVYSIEWQKIAALASEATGGRYSLLLAGQSYEVFARRLPAQPGQRGLICEIFLGDQRFEVTVEDERSQLLARVAHTENKSNAAYIQAPMPGLVVNVLVEVGATVEQGQTVVVLQAMKMENDLASPIAGTIKEVRVSKGQTVEQGELLVTVEGKL